jgi:hypothetical protein
MKDCPVMWTSIHHEKIHHWRKMFVISNIILILICAFFYAGWYQESNKQVEVNTLQLQLKDYKVRNEILTVLRTKGIILNQGLDIADALMIQCRDKNIPIELGIAIMRRERGYDQLEISSAGARGLMQLLPETFDIINHRLKLGLPRSAIIDPIINIKFAVIHLADLIEEVKPRSKTIDEMWKNVLVRYSGNARGYPEAVVKMKKEYEVKFRDGEI